MKVIVLFLLLFINLYIGLVIPSYGYLDQQTADEGTDRPPGSSRFSCSIFTVEYNGTVYFGGNEDESGARKNTQVKFQPAETNDTYGTAVFGFVDNEPGGDDVDDLGISGINEKGLCFDANGLPPPLYVSSNMVGPMCSGIEYWEIILRECADVSEVMEWHHTHNMGGWWGNQVHWADPSGAAVVISPLSGAVAFTERNEHDSFLVSTNFNLADHSHGYYPCSRYITITDSLDQYIQRGDITIKSLKTLLKAVHLQGTASYVGTVYTHIFNLNTREIFLYILGNYGEVCYFNLTEELNKDAHSYKLTADLIENLSSTTSTTVGFHLGWISFWMIPLVFWKRTKLEKL